MILKTIDLEKKYGNFLALEKVNISLKSGEIVGLLGPNGSGKTTFLKAINKMIPVNSGKVLMNDREINYTDDLEISYLPDADFLQGDMTCTKLSKFYSDFFPNFDNEKFEKMIKDFDVPMNKTLKSLSKGMYKKVQIALCISRNVSFYFLDEPLGGIDLVARKTVIESILDNYNKKACLLISTHLIGEIENILDRVIFLQNGKVVLDDSCEKIRDEKAMSVSNLYLEVYDA